MIFETTLDGLATCSTGREYSVTHELPDAMSLWVPLSGAPNLRERSPSHAHKASGDPPSLKHLFPLHYKYRCTPQDQVRKQGMSRKIQ
jgi:hypothetical protein